MDIAGDYSLDVACHGHAARVFGVVPDKFYAQKLGAFPVLSNGIVLLEDVA